MARRAARVLLAQAARDADGYRRRPRRRADGRHLHPHRHDQPVVRGDLPDRPARARRRRRPPSGARRDRQRAERGDRRRDARARPRGAGRGGRLRRGVLLRDAVRRRGQAPEHPRAELRRLDPAGALRELLGGVGSVAARRGRRRDRRGDRPTLLAESRPGATRRGRDRGRPLPDLGRRSLRRLNVVRRRGRRAPHARAGAARQRRARRVRHDRRRGEAGHLRRNAPRADPRGAAADPRRAHRRAAGGEADIGPREPAELPADLPADLRLRRPVRRRVHHLQHVLDHGRAAHARVRAAAHARGDARAAARLGRGGGPDARARRLGGRPRCGPWPRAAPRSG